MSSLNPPLHHIGTLLVVLLALSDARPEEPGPRVTTSTSGPLHAPRFMMDLYQQEVRNSSILQGAIVRSFPGRSDGSSRVFNLPPRRGPGERISRAEIRWPRPPVVGASPGVYEVELYQVQKGEARPCSGTLITSRVIAEDAGGWAVLDVTHTVTRWIHSNTSGHSVRLLSSPGPLEEAESWAESRADETYLVLYSHDVMRSSATGPDFPEFLERRSSPQTRVRRRRDAAATPPVACQRTALYVDFTKLGWSNWIISPKGYHAYHCAGSCPFPLGANVRPTNHAVVQSIVNALQLSAEVGRPCCVPDQLHPISLLYLDDEENVVLKQYEDMVVANCGCH